MNLPSLPSANGIASFFKQSTTIHGIAVLAADGVAFGLHQVDAATAISIGIGGLIAIIMQQEATIPPQLASKVSILEDHTALKNAAIDLAPAAYATLVGPDDMTHKAMDLANSAMSQVQRSSDALAAIAAAPVAYPVDLSAIHGKLDALSQQIADIPPAVVQAAPAPAPVPVAPIAGAPAAA